MARNRHGVCRLYVITSVIGFLIGIFLANWCTTSILSRCGLNNACCFGDFRISSQSEKMSPSEAQIEHAQGKGTSSFVFIGVMTAKKFIDNRGLASHRTWANHINGKVMFFSSQGSVSVHGVPVIALDGVDDSYPPQRKSFMMLKYMHDNFIEKFQWFVRADDDVFIKVGKLEKFLRSINSSSPHFIGQAGVGKSSEIGLLGLKLGENFCMGGPGMIFSRETLRRVGPHIGYCLQHLYTSHEDVEIGRCVRMFAGIQCTWSYEMQHILYQNYKEDQGSFKETLKSKAVEKAISLHPVKDPNYQYRIFNYLQSVKIMKLKQRQVQLFRELCIMDSMVRHSGMLTDEDKRICQMPRMNQMHRQLPEEIITWQYFTKSSIFSHLNNNPRRGLDGFFSAAVKDAVEQAMELINVNSQKHNRSIDFKDILNGYYCVNTLIGADIILDLSLIYSSYGFRKMALQVWRRIYLQQAFLWIEAREKDTFFTSTTSLSERFLRVFRELLWQRPSTPSIMQDKRNETIHFVMSLAGRLATFERFLQNFEEVCLRHREAVRLVVVLYRAAGGQEEHTGIVALMHDYRHRYGSGVFTLVHATGTFSRGRGLELGAQQCPSNGLLFLIDVDIMWTRDSLMRMRLNAELGKQVYFPIVFSQYNPETVCHQQYKRCWCNHTHGCVINPQDFHSSTGNWRHFGFGIAVMYRADMLAVGGYNLSIQGWGKEDVDLYTNFIQSHLTVFRAVDPGMTHVFHAIECDPRLDTAKRIMCVNSKYQNYGDEALLANAVLSMNDIMKRGDKHLLIPHR